jgi:hypothetical protein
MSDPYRPTPKQHRLFDALAKEIRAHAEEYLSATHWFTTEFSIGAIDARFIASLPTVGRQIRDERLRSGSTDNTGSDSSGYMKRLLRATDWLIKIDDSALPRAVRMEHYHRAVLVAVLITDPDVLTEVTQIASALAVNRAHWPTVEALTIGSDEHEADRFWAREFVFDPRVPKWQAFEPLAKRALKALKRMRPDPATTAAPEKEVNAAISDQIAGRDATLRATERASRAMRRTVGVDHQDDDDKSAFTCELTSPPEVRRHTLTLRLQHGPQGRPVVHKIVGKTQAFLAQRVITEPDHDHTWADLLRAGNDAGAWTITSADSVRKAGSRIYERLPAPLKGHWGQSMSGVRWQSV